jgi:hypothetical protein
MVIAFASQNKWKSQSWAKKLMKISVEFCQKDAKEHEMREVARMKEDENQRLSAPPWPAAWLLCLHQHICVCPLLAI